MTGGQILTLVGHLQASLTKHGVLDANGDFVKQPALLEAGDLAAVVGDVEAELKADGVPVPPQLEKAVKLAPEILGLIGGIVG